MKKTTENQTRRVARIFEEVGGFCYCDESLSFLDARGGQFPTRRAAVRAIVDSNKHRDNPYTHYRIDDKTKKL